MGPVISISSCLVTAFFWPTTPFRRCFLRSFPFLFFLNTPLPTQHSFGSSLVESRPVLFPTTIIIILSSTAVTHFQGEFSSVRIDFAHHAHLTNCPIPRYSLQLLAVITSVHTSDFEILKVFGTHSGTSTYPRSKRRYLIQQSRRLLPFPIPRVIRRRLRKNVFQISHCCFGHCGWSCPSESP